MDFAKRLYKVQTILYGIIMVLSLAGAGISGVWALINLISANNNGNATSLGQGLLFALLIIFAVAFAVIGAIMIVLFVASRIQYKSIKISKTEFLNKKNSRVLNVIFSVVVVVAGIIFVILDSELILKILMGVFALFILIFLILDIVAVKKVKYSVNLENEQNISDIQNNQESNI